MNKYSCPNCGGSGADKKKTDAARRAGNIDAKSYIRCWNCNGHGLDPIKFFRCSK